VAGLRVTPQRSESSSTGYKSVYCGVSKPKPSQAQVRRGGTDVTLSSFAYGFATPEEAALCYARSPEAQAAAAAPTEPPPTHAPTTAEEALRQAEVDRLRLLESASSSGYNGVSFSSGKAKPSSLADAEAAAVHRAQVSRGGTQVYLDTFFATAEEAALCYARSPEAQAAAAAQTAQTAPPPVTAEEVLRQAEAEGLTLLRSECSNSGYKCVTFNNSKSSKSSPYQVQACRGGKHRFLGCFATPEEAALCYARSPEAQAAAAAPPKPPPPKPPPLTAEEVLRQAEAEGLTLLKSEGGSTGYKGVGFDSRGKAKPYRAQTYRGGKQVFLGCFATAEEAALCYARSPEVQGATAAPIEPPPLTAEEALRQADAEGLTLPKSESSNTGYLNVCFISRLASKPYQTQVRRGGKQVRFGRFATAEEAALSYARTSEAQATAPQPPPASSRKRKVTLEEQPPDVVDVPTDVVVILEGRFVESTTLE